MRWERAGSVGATQARGAGVLALTLPKHNPNGSSRKVQAKMLLWKAPRSLSGTRPLSWSSNSGRLILRAQRSGVEFYPALWASKGKGHPKNRSWARLYVGVVAPSILSTSTRGGSHSCSSPCAERAEQPLLATASGLNDPNSLGVALGSCAHIRPCRSQSVKVCLPRHGQLVARWDSAEARVEHQLPRADTEILRLCTLGAFSSRLGHSYMKGAIMAGGCGQSGMQK